MGLYRITALLLLLSPALLHAFQPVSSSLISSRPSIHEQERRTTAVCPLHSLRGLIDHVEEQQQTNSKQKKTPTIFVGGKGGVGKTSVSSALAVELAQTRNVLIVSTDPAHSLGDCLDVDTLSATPTSITLINDAMGSLYAQEIDAAAALTQFREALAAFDVDRLAGALQIPPDLLQSLGLDELSSVLQNPPPGLDELVALAEVFGDNTDGNKYDAIVVDTAPTGHTLRLLALPQFLDGLLGKLMQLRLRLSGIASTLQSLLGGGSAAAQRAAAVDDALQRIEKFQQRMRKLRTTLTDAEQTQFIVVSIPTALSVAESERLVTELQAQDVAVANLVVNQCMLTSSGDTTTANAYYQRRHTSQHKWIERLRDRVATVSASKEYQSNGSPNAPPIRLTQVPFFDVELVGVAALGYVGSQVFAGSTSDTSIDSRVVVCGGKGGVGKTTTSASLAVTLAAAGDRVALISTDPAHSLGDAVGMPLTGSLQPCPLIGVPGNVGTGSLDVMEIDPSKALNTFKGYLDQLLSSDAVSNPAIGDTLKEMADIFDTLPAGTDEVVALAQIVQLVKKEDTYDKIILDTAPTGHTLRMMSTPGFIADLIDRLLKISDKLNSSSAVQLFLGSRREEMATAVQAAKSKLLSFQFQMFDLEDMFSDPDTTEFLIVTIPTELAVRESMRLLNDLTFDEDLPVKVKNVVVNQVLDENDDGQRFQNSIVKRQHNALENLTRLAERNDIAVTKVPYLDTEPRGVYGLRALASELVKEKVEAQ